jgi:replicative DNA helicase
MAIIDINFEDKVLACLLKSGEFCAVAAHHLKPSYFENPVKHNLSKMGIEFWKEYGTKLTPTGFVWTTKTLVESKTIKEADLSHYVEERKRLLSIDVSDWKFILEKLIIFIKNRETKKLIEDAVKKHLPKNDFTSIEKGMADIAAITTTSEVKPYDYFSVKTIDERAKRREHEMECKAIGISTGIKRMDEIFPKKGWYRRELYTILAPPKKGKSMALGWFANMATLQGFNVALFSCENSTEITSDRLDAMNAKVLIASLGRGNHKEVADKVKSIGCEGSLMLFEYPTKRLTCPEVERQLRKLEIEKGVTVDFLIVDYADIMKPSRTYEDKLYEQATIYEDLRALATVFDIPVLTASQINRAGSEKKTLSGKDVAGTWEKIMVSDAVITLSSTEDEKKDNRVRIHFAECRNMESKTIRIATSYGMGKFYSEYIDDLEADEA